MPYIRSLRLLPLPLLLPAELEPEVGGQLVDAAVADLRPIQKPVDDWLRHVGDFGQV